MAPGKDDPQSIYQLVPPEPQGVQNHPHQHLSALPTWTSRRREGVGTEAVGEESSCLLYGCYQLRRMADVGI